LFYEEYVGCISRSGKYPWKEALMITSQWVYVYSYIFHCRARRYTCIQPSKQ
jgi:hypothetical protein